MASPPLVSPRRDRTRRTREPSAAYWSDRDLDLPVLVEHRHVDGRSRAWRPVAIAVLTAAVLLVPLWTASAAVIDSADQTLQWLAVRNDVTARAGLTVAIVSGASIALVLRWARATALRRPVRLADGHGTIDIDEVERRLEALWLERADVVAADGVVENRHRHGVRVSARIAVTADARLDETSAAAALIAEMLIIGRIGVPLAARPRIELRYRELDLKAGRAHDY